MVKTMMPIVRMANVVCDRGGHRYKAPKDAVWPVSCPQCGGDAAPSWWHSKNALDKFKKHVEAGRVEIGNKAVDPSRGPFDQKDAVRLFGFDGGLVFAWARRGVGFGELTLKAGEDGRLVADMEGMSDAFCLAVVAQALKEAKRR